ncbi:MAG: hypothetical protein JW982_00070 [Spirochaetes bacterium]|nr:hypothetical protein [Spirochaetota bacterium]
MLKLRQDPNMTFNLKKIFIRLLINRKLFYYSAVIMLFTVISAGIYADSRKIIVYPSPVNINRESASIGPEPGNTYYSGLNLKVKFSIYSVSGDLVFTRTVDAAGFPVLHWRGYDNNGKKVSQGLYILKVVIENKDTGTVDIQKIRFLIKK